MHIVCMSCQPAYLAGLSCSLIDTSLSHTHTHTHTGGPIKESKIGMAQTQRAMGRKSEPAKDEAGSVAVDGTDVDKFEEKAQVCVIQSG